MKVITKQPYHYICDICKKKIDEAVIEVNFNYGSIFDGDKIDFCSDKCFKKYAKEWGNST